MTTRFGQIVGGGRAYQITDDDLLWLARAVEFEGGTAPEATAWVYAQRLVYLPWSGSLASLVRAHSQPLNPAWASTSSSGCVTHPELCSPAALARREQARTMPWGSLSARTRDVVTRFAEARLPNPIPRAVDFAAAALAARKLDAGQFTRAVLRAGNTYLATVASEAWGVNHVVVRYRGRVAGVLESARWQWWALGLVGLGAGWWAWRCYLKAA